MRQDYIEPDYINGVRNEDGEMVIRPLTHKEKKFLNDYYEETINANFVHDEELKELSKRIKVLKKLENPTKDEIEEHDYLQMLYFERADEVLLYENDCEQKKIYGENNARNRCLYNRTKASGGLIPFNTDEYDEEIENSMYYDPETGRNIYIDPIEYQRKQALKKRDED